MCEIFKLLLPSNRLKLSDLELDQAANKLHIIYKNDVWVNFSSEVLLKIQLSLKQIQFLQKWRTWRNRQCKWRLKLQLKIFQTDVRFLEAKMLTFLLNPMNAEIILPISGAPNEESGSQTVDIENGPMQPKLNSYHPKMYDHLRDFQQS